MSKLILMAVLVGLMAATTSTCRAGGYGGYFVSTQIIAGPGGPIYYPYDDLYISVPALPFYSSETCFIGEPIDCTSLSGSKPDQWSAFSYEPYQGYDFADLAIGKDGTLSGEIHVTTDQNTYDISGSGINWTAWIIGSDMIQDCDSSSPYGLCEAIGYFEPLVIKPVSEPSSMFLVTSMLCILGLGLFRSSQVMAR